VDGFSKGKASGMIEDNMAPYIITDASALITTWYEAWNNYYSKVQDALDKDDTEFLEKYVFYVSNVATDTSTTPAP
jgi:archaellum component FlaF (FlaF/FlaG flagellin family)